MSHFLISAAHKSSGKTTLSIGLCAALAESGLQVQPFKKGPDYIDPMWLSRASGRPCHNLDFYTMQQDEICATFAQQSATADISLIEGNKGLFDGLDLHGSNSNAALARLLGAPVVLVLDTRGVSRGVAPLILGYQSFEADINIAGVILNQVGGSRHETKLREVIEHYTDVKVIGAVQRNPDLSIEERHLGLMPSNEDDSADRKIMQIRDLVKQQVDITQLRAIASTAPEIAVAEKSTSAPIQLDSPVTIGVVKNDAFGFYYPGDLQALEDCGAKLVTIDTIRDTELPEIDGLFIGGGFPETHIEVLSANRTMRESIKQALQDDLPCYAECGGLMYLSRNLSWNEQQGDMVGFVPADCVMHEKPQGRGYIKLEETPLHPWLDCPPQPAPVIAAHEFHYSSLENLDPDVKFAYRVKRGSGITGEFDGIVINNTLACYAHLRDTASNHWVQRFVQFVQHCKRTKRSNT